MTKSDYEKQLSKGGTYLIQFYKVDGTQRTMLATTDFDKLSSSGYAYIPPKGLRKPNPNIVVVWDLQKDAFRSFRPDSVFGFKKISDELISSYNPNITITMKELVEKLDNDNLKITFIKQDNTERVMNCTRNHDGLSAPSNTSPIINVWDLDKEDVRNINYDRILKIDPSDIKMTNLQRLASRFRRTLGRLTNFSRVRKSSIDPDDYSLDLGDFNIYDPDDKSLVKIDKNGYYLIKNLFDARYIHDKIMKRDGKFPKCKVVTKDASLLFNGLDKVKEFEEVITTGVTCMYSMFSSCTNLLKAPKLDMSNVKDCSLLFAQCYKIRSFPEYNVKNVEVAFGMFSQCDSVYDLPALKFNKKVDLKEVFQGFFPSSKKVGTFLKERYGINKWTMYIIDPRIMKNALSALKDQVTELIKKGDKKSAKKLGFDISNQIKDKVKELNELKNKVRKQLQRFKIV